MKESNSNDHKLAMKQMEEHIEEIELQVFLELNVSQIILEKKMQEEIKGFQEIFGNYEKEIISLKKTNVELRLNY